MYNDVFNQAVLVREVVHIGFLYFILSLRTLGLVPFRPNHDSS
jgi:hypothetical protein